MLKERNSRFISAPLAFAVVSFSLGELGDGLNIFQGIYLVGLGWNEGSVGLALSLMGLTTLLVQTVAGDFVDKTTLDRRLFLAIASVVTALSASAIFIVQEGNSHHGLIYITKVIEGIAGSFIGPCLAALTLASFGPLHFDRIMASNILWGHWGSVVAAVLAGGTAYMLYPNIKYCFLVIGASALLAILFVQYLPQGDVLMGRGFHGTTSYLNEHGQLEKIDEGDDEDSCYTESGGRQQQQREEEQQQAASQRPPPQAARYREIFADRKTAALCVAGFFFHFANANVLLVLGEIMGRDENNGEDDAAVHKRSAIPLIAGAIVVAQVIMALTTNVGDRLTHHFGVGRKPLLIAGLLTLPVRCALIIVWENAGEAWLLSTQVLDGIGGGLVGLIHPYIVADVTFGTGRFNVIMGLTASAFGLGATLSNFLGQLVVEKMGHAAALMGSLVLSVVPILVVAFFLPETFGNRGSYHVVMAAPTNNQEDGANANNETATTTPYVEMGEQRKSVEVV